MPEENSHRSVSSSLGGKNKETKKQQQINRKLAM